MKKATENDVFKLFWPVAIRECKNLYKGLEWEDRVEEAGIALLYCIRTYKTRYGNFKSYLLMQLPIIMKQKNTEAWGIKRLEANLSLDAPLFWGGNSFSLSSCVGASFEADSALEFQNFLSQLSPTEKRVAQFLAEGLSTRKIAKEIGLPQGRMQAIISALKHKAEDYFGRRSFGLKC